MGLTQLLYGKKHASKYEALYLRVCFIQNISWSELKREEKLCILINIDLGTIISLSDIYASGRWNQFHNFLLHGPYFTQSLFSELDPLCLMNMASSICLSNDFYFLQPNLYFYFVGSIINASSASHPSFSKIILAFIK